MSDHSLATNPRQTYRDEAALSSEKREEIVLRYWLKGDLTPLAVANSLAGRPTATQTA